jgi:hypothetical protein
MSLVNILENGIEATTARNRYADHPDYEPMYGQVEYHQKKSLDFLKGELMPEATEEEWGAFCKYNEDEGEIRELVANALRQQFALFQVERHDPDRADGPGWEDVA